MNSRFGWSCVLVDFYPIKFEWKHIGILIFIDKILIKILEKLVELVYVTVKSIEHRHFGLGIAHHNLI